MGNSGKNTSRRCPVCGLIDPKNRPSQAVFHCVRCGFEDNADHAAAINIRDRGIDMLLSGLYKPRTRKKLLRTKKAKPSSVKPGPDRANVMPVELTASDKTLVLSHVGVESGSLRIRAGVDHLHDVREHPAQR